MSLAFTQQQLQDLAKSGITPETAIEAGVRPISDPIEAARMLGWEGLGPVPALLFPYFPLGDLSKEPVFSRLKPDLPRAVAEKRVKYEQPKGTSTDIYVPGNVNREALLDTRTPLFLTEGEKKAIKMNAEGFAALAAPGVCNFHNSEAGPFSVLKDSLRQIPLQGRDVYIVFDAAKFFKPQVLRAEIALAKMLDAAGACVHLIDLTSSSDLPVDQRHDLGVDDYMAQIGSQAFEEFAIPAATPYPFRLLFERFRGDPTALSLDGDRLTAYAAIMPNPFERDEVKEFLVNELRLRRSSVNQAIKQYRARPTGASKPRPVEEPDREYIDISDRRTVESRCEDIIQALARTGKAYRLGDLLAIVSQGKAQIITTANQFGGALADTAECYVEGDGGRAYRPLPRPLGETILNRPSCIGRFPKIVATADVPVYDIRADQDGSYRAENVRLLNPGFDQTSGILVTGRAIEPVASGHRLHRLLSDAPYKDGASKANRLGALFLRVFPTAFTGARPMVLFQGNQSGVGKSYAATTDQVISYGKQVAHITYTTDDCELEKRLATAVLAGAQEIFIDNAKVGKQEISSAALERSVTAQTLNFRKLGGNEEISRPNTIPFSLTANCPKLSNDLVNRCIAVNLLVDGDPDDYKRVIPNHHDYAQVNRLEIWAELLGMVELWKSKGCPLARPNLHRFGTWASVIGGILEANGIQGFLENVNETKEAFSSELRDLSELFSSDPALKAKPKTIAEKACGMGLFKDLLQGRAGSGHAMAGLLKRYLGRRVTLEDGTSRRLQSEEDKHHKAPVYFLGEDVLRKPAPSPQQYPPHNSSKSQEKMENCGDADSFSSEKRESLKNKALSYNEKKCAPVMGQSPALSPPSPQTGILDSENASLPRRKVAETAGVADSGISAGAGAPRNTEDWAP